jgi:hypothetical protein
MGRSRGREMASEKLERHGLGQPWGTNASLKLGEFQPPRKLKHANNPEKYTGELRKRISMNGPRDGEIWRKVRLLCEHHGVENEDWLGLAMALAFTHVPGFQHSRSGRKPSPMTIKKRFRQWLAAQPNQLLAMASLPDSLVNYASGLKPQQRRGRPRTNPPEQDRRLVRGADKWRQIQRDAGARRQSDRAYVEDQLKRIFTEHPDWLSESAREHRTTKAGAVKKLVNYWTVRLARARKSVSKTSGN